MSDLEKSVMTKYSWKIGINEYQIPKAQLGYVVSGRKRKERSRYRTLDDGFNPEL